MTSFTRRNYAIRDGEISALHFGPQDKPVELLFLHANGFNAQTYRTVLEPLGVHVIALDLRGHGHSHALPINPKTMKNYEAFITDIVEFAQTYIDGSFVIAGHSLGAICGLFAVEKLGPKISSYVGLDTVSLPPLLYAGSRFRFFRNITKNHLPLAKNAGRRKSVFKSREEALGRYTNRGAFKKIDVDILKDYLDSGLIKKDGNYHLACSPALEQALFAAQNHNPYKAARHLPDNSYLVYAGGKDRVSSAYTRAKMGRMQPNISVSCNPDLLHLFPLQNPHIATKALKMALDL